jgi:hypothetical protein
LSAAQMNAISDDLKYLHGDSGAITLINQLNVSPASGTAGVKLTAPTTADFVAIELAGGHVWQLGTGGSATGAPYANSLYLMDETAGPIRLLLDGGGNMTKITGAGGGFLFLSATAVTTLQTLAPAGTVTASAIFFAYDRNNTTGTGIQAFAAGSLMSLGSGGVTYTNTDTMKVDLTAGGAITVARTAGTNGTHEVDMLVCYK